eukprot:TRINITY_DN4560_c0_g1_i2.p1 TRINITY_DN4560_c0_g1~~TRINITY_DN4560_c0_g1_i2.p1  ORF type:complete len:142 (+),score=19.14 TRINITY_DN4560_c0_g1_i2:46-471(+)
MEAGPSSASVRSRVGGVDEEDVAQLRLGDDFGAAQCLLSSEVQILLQHRKDREHGVDVSPVFSKTLGYVDRFSRFKNKTALKQVRGMLSRQGLAEYEAAAIGNLLPETAEEAKALIPSLQRMTDDDLQIILNDVTSYRRFD